MMPTPFENQWTFIPSTVASLQPRIPNRHFMLRPPPPGIPIIQRPYPASPPENFFRGTFRGYRMPLRSNRPLNCPFLDRRRHGRKRCIPPAMPQLRFWMQPIFQRFLSRLPPLRLRHRLPRSPSTTLPWLDYGRNSNFANHSHDGRPQLSPMSPNLHLMMHNTPRRRRRRRCRRSRCIMNRVHLEVAFNNDQQAFGEQEDDEEEIHNACEAYKDLHYYNNNDDDDNDDGYINSNNNVFSNTGIISS